LEKKNKVFSLQQTTIFMTDEEKLDNCLMVIQIPLKNNPDYKPKSMARFCSFGSYSEEDDSEESYRLSRGMRRGMDMGVLSKGSKNGKYVGTGTTKLERDDNYPIRCTYQYYRLTDEENLTEDLVKNIVEQLNNINNIATNSGSLVMNTTDRITEPKLEPKLEPKFESRLEPNLEFKIKSLLESNKDEKKVDWNNQSMLAM
jgi:hypothetical protein